MLLRAAVLLVFWAIELPAAAIVIRDVTVIDGTGSPPLPRQTMVITGKRISQIGPTARVKIPAGATVIDGRGRYAIPGLWDMHVHLWSDRNQLPLYVARGVTGVRDMGSDFSRTNRWRTAVEAGTSIGPHVVTSGPAVDGRAGRDPRLPVLVALTPDDGRRTFDQLDGMDADFISVQADLPRDSYIALAERARKWRLPFSGEVPSAISVMEAIEARQSSIDRLAGLPAACSLDAARAAETFDEGRAREVFRRSAMMGTRHVPMLHSWEREGKKNFELANRMVKLMRECGVEVLAGTDTGETATTPGLTLHRELELLVKAGFTPMQALQSATLFPARFLEWDSAVGVLKRGMVADIVLLDANPLADIRNVSRVSGVFSRGRYLNQAQIKATVASNK
jgi:imidazolonepropionase-like amidohydrolase